MDISSTNFIAVSHTHPNKINNNQLSNDDDVFVSDSIDSNSNGSETEFDNKNVEKTIMNHIEGENENDITPVGRKINLKTHIPSTTSNRLTIEIPQNVEIVEEPLERVQVQEPIQLRLTEALPNFRLIPDDEGHYDDGGSNVSDSTCNDYSNSNKNGNGNKQYKIIINKQINSK